jgi:hypothetical protein
MPVYVVWSYSVPPPISHADLVSLTSSLLASPDVWIVETRTYGIINAILHDGHTGPPQGVDAHPEGRHFQLVEGRNTTRIDTDLLSSVHTLQNEPVTSEQLQTVLDGTTRVVQDELILEGAQGLIQDLHTPQPDDLTAPPDDGYSRNVTVPPGERQRHEHVTLVNHSDLRVPYWTSREGCHSGNANGTLLQNTHAILVEPIGSDDTFAAVNVNGVLHLVPTICVARHQQEPDSRNDEEAEVQAALEAIVDDIPEHTVISSTATPDEGQERRFTAVNPNAVIAGSRESRVPLWRDNVPTDPDAAPDGYIISNVQVRAGTRVWGQEQPPRNFTHVTLLDLNRSSGWVHSVHIEEETPSHTNHPPEPAVLRDPTLPWSRDVPYWYHHDEAQNHHDGAYNGTLPPNTAVHVVRYEHEVSLIRSPRLPQDIWVASGAVIQTLEGEQAAQPEEGGRNRPDDVVTTTPDPPALAFTHQTYPNASISTVGSNEGVPMWHNQPSRPIDINGEAGAEGIITEETNVTVIGNRNGYANVILPNGDSGWVPASTIDPLSDQAPAINLDPPLTFIVTLPFDGLPLHTPFQATAVRRPPTGIQYQIRADDRLVWVPARNLTPPTQDEPDFVTVRDEPRVLANLQGQTHTWRDNGPQQSWPNGTTVQVVNRDSGLISTGVVTTIIDPDGFRARVHSDNLGPAWVENETTHTHTTLNPFNPELETPFWDNARDFYSNVDHHEDDPDGSLPPGSPVRLISVNNDWATISHAGHNPVAIWSNALRLIQVDQPKTPPKPKTRYDRLSED